MSSAVVRVSRVSLAQRARVIDRLRLYTGVLCRVLALPFLRLVIFLRRRRRLNDSATPLRFLVTVML